MQINIHTCTCIFFYVGSLGFKAFGRWTTPERKHILHRDSSLADRYLAQGKTGDLNNYEIINIYPLQRNVVPNC